MAKKKEAVEEVNDSAIAVKDIIRKEYGDVLISGTDILKKKEEIFSLSPSLDLALGGGIPAGCTVISAAKAKFGKCLRKFSKVYTPDGFKFIQDLKIGDDILTPNGVAQVCNTYFGGNNEIYKVEFANGDIVECDLDHLWSVRYIDHHQSQLLTTRELLEKKLINNCNKLLWKIELPQPVLFDKREVKIPPYILGVLIGDGGLTGTTVRLTNTDEDLLTKVNDNLTTDYILKNTSSVNPTISYSIVRKQKKNSHYKNYYTIALTEYGLTGKNSHNKFIPEDYIYNSLECRIDLFNGLIDTDGTVTKKGNLSYCTVSRRLAVDVKNLVHSLGGIANIHEREYPNSFVVNIRFQNPTFLNLIKRKQKRLKIRNSRVARSIKSITKAGYKDDVFCIKINNKDGLFLTDNFVVTHNTTLALRAAKSFLDTFPQGHVWHMDIESRLRARNLQGTEGIDASRFDSICPTRIDKDGNVKLLTAEEYLDIVRKLLILQPYSFVILDSISALVPESELIVGPSGELRAKSPKLISHFLKQTCGLVKHNKSVLWSIHQLYANTSGYGAGFLPDGGTKITYLSDVFLMQAHPTKQIEYWPPPKKDKDGKVTESPPALGQVCEWLIPYTALNAPMRKAKSYITFGKGIDEVREVLELGIEFGIINKGGAWIKYGENNWQGSEKAYQALNSDKNLYNEIYSKLREIMGCKSQTSEDIDITGGLSPELLELCQVDTK